MTKKGKRSSIMVRIFGGFIVITLIAVGLLLFTLSRIHSMANDAGSLDNTYLPLYRQTNAVFLDSVKEIATLRAYVITGDEAQVEKFTALAEESTQIYDKLIANSTTEAGTKLITEAKDLHATYIKNATESLIPAVKEGDKDKILNIMKTLMVPTATALDAKLSDYQVRGETQMSEMLGGASKAAALTEQIVIFALVGFCIVALILSFVIARIIIKPIKIMQDGLLKAEKNNDLTMQVIIKSNDEIGEMAEALNSFMKKYVHHSNRFQKVHSRSMIQ